MQLVQTDNEKRIEFDETDLVLLDQFKGINDKIAALNDRIQMLIDFDVQGLMGEITGLQSSVLGNTQWCWMEVAKKLRKAGVAEDIDFDTAVFDNVTNSIILDAKDVEVEKILSIQEEVTKIQGELGTPHAGV